MFIKKFGVKLVKNRHIMLYYLWDNVIHWNPFIALSNCLMCCKKFL